MAGWVGGLATQPLCAGDTIGREPYRALCVHRQSSLLWLDELRLRGHRPQRTSRGRTDAGRTFYFSARPKIAAARPLAALAVAQAMPPTLSVKATAGEAAAPIATPATPKTASPAACIAPPTLARASGWSGTRQPAACRHGRYLSTKSCPKTSRICLKKSIPECQAITNHEKRKLRAPFRMLEPWKCASSASTLYWTVYRSYRLRYRTEPTPNRQVPKVSRRCTSTEIPNPAGIERTEPKHTLKCDIPGSLSLLAGSVVSANLRNSPPYVCVIAEERHHGLRRSIQSFDKYAPNVQVTITK